MRTLLHMTRTLASTLFLVHQTKKSIAAITFERKRKVINNPCLNWESLSVYGGNRKLKVLSIKFSS
jgi:hypothetical protein